MLVVDSKGTTFTLWCQNIYSHVHWTAQLEKESSGCEEMPRRVECDQGIHLCHLTGIQHIFTNLVSEEQNMEICLASVERKKFGLRGVLGSHSELAWWICQEATVFSHLLLEVWHPLFLLTIPFPEEGKTMKHQSWVKENLQSQQQLQTLNRSKNLKSGVSPNVLQEDQCGKIHAGLTNFDPKCKHAQLHFSGILLTRGKPLVITCTEIDNDCSVFNKFSSFPCFKNKGQILRFFCLFDWTKKSFINHFLFSTKWHSWKLPSKMLWLIFFPESSAVVSWSGSVASASMSTWPGAASAGFAWTSFSKVATQTRRVIRNSNMVGGWWNWWVLRLTTAGIRQQMLCRADTWTHTLTHTMLQSKQGIRGGNGTSSQGHPWSLTPILTSVVMITGHFEELCCGPRLQIQNSDREQCPTQVWININN